MKLISESFNSTEALHVNKVFSQSIPPQQHKQPLCDQNTTTLRIDKRHIPTGKHSSTPPQQHKQLCDQNTTILRIDHPHIPTGKHSSTPLPQQHKHHYVTRTQPLSELTSLISLLEKTAAAPPPPPPPNNTNNTMWPKHNHITNLQASYSYWKTQQHPPPQ